ncbi:MAG: hypothetical protein ACYTDU_11880 [Planctomycetota bacterium]|jgi:hypothetical protein
MAGAFPDSSRISSCPFRGVLGPPRGLVAHGDAVRGRAPGGSQAGRLLGDHHALPRLAGPADLVADAADFDGDVDPARQGDGRHEQGDG